MHSWIMVTSAGLTQRSLGIGCADSSAADKEPSAVDAIVVPKKLRPEKRRSKGQALPLGNSIV